MEVTDHSLLWHIVSAAISGLCKRLLPVEFVTCRWGWFSENRSSENFTCIRGMTGKERLITCRPIGKLFMLIVVKLPSALVLYLRAMFVWQCLHWLRLSETCLKWQRRSKVPPNPRCVPSYDFSKQMVSVQRKFTNKLLLFYDKVINWQKFCVTASWIVVSDTPRKMWRNSLIVTSLFVRNFPLSFL